MSLNQTTASTPFVRWLADLAAERGWTSGRQAAKYLGVNQAAFATWLRGEYLPDAASQEQLARGARVSPDVVAELVRDSRPRTVSVDNPELAAILREMGTFPPEQQPAAQRRVLDALEQLRAELGRQAS